MSRLSALLTSRGLPSRVYVSEAAVRDLLADLSIHDHETRRAMNALLAGEPQSFHGPSGLVTLYPDENRSDIRYWMYRVRT